MDSLYTVIDEQMIDYSPSYFALVGVFLNLEDARAGALAHLADPEVDAVCDDRLLSLSRSLPGERGKAEWLGNYNPKGQWMPAGEYPTQTGFYSCGEC